MHVFFADDSERKGSRPDMGQLVAFGGVYFDESALGSVDEGFRTVLTDLGIPEDTEVKWSLPPGNWIREELADGKRPELYRRLLQVAQNHDGRVIVSVIDVGRLQATEEECFRDAVKFVFERFDTNLSYVGDDALGLIVADRPSGDRQDEQEFLSSFLEHVDRGTEFVDGEHVPFNIVTTGSRFVRHLQLADLITSVTSAMVQGDYRYAEPVFDEIKPMFITNWRGLIGGTGLKLHPSHLGNLYYHLFDEDVKVRRGTGRGLPEPKWPYSDDEAAGEQTRS